MAAEQIAGGKTWIQGMEKEIVQFKRETLQPSKQSKNSVDSEESDFATFFPYTRWKEKDKENNDVKIAIGKIEVESVAQKLARIRNFAETGARLVIKAENETEEARAMIKSDESIEGEERVKESVKDAIRKAKAAATKVRATKLAKFKLKIAKARLSSDGTGKSTGNASSEETIGESKEVSTENGLGELKTKISELKKMMENKIKVLCRTKAGIDTNTKDGRDDNNNEETKEDEIRDMRASEPEPKSIRCFFLAIRRDLRSSRELNEEELPMEEARVDLLTTKAEERLPDVVPEEEILGGEKLVLKVEAREDLVPETDVLVPDDPIQSESKFNGFVFQTEEMELEMVAAGFVPDSETGTEITGRLGSSLLSPDCLYNSGLNWIGKGARFGSVAKAELDSDDSSDEEENSKLANGHAETTPTKATPKSSKKMDVVVDDGSDEDDDKPPSEGVKCATLKGRHVNGRGFCGLASCGRSAKVAPKATRVKEVGSLKNDKAERVKAWLIKCI